MVGHLGDIDVKWLIQEDAELVVLSRWEVADASRLLQEQVLDVAAQLDHWHCRIVNECDLADPLVLKLVLELSVNLGKNRLRTVDTVLQAVVMFPNWRVLRGNDDKVDVRPG